MLNSATELRSVCPFCNSLTQSGRVDGKFYINTETGLYYCFHCQVKGRDLTEEQLENLDVIDEILKKPFDQSSLAKLQQDTPETKRFSSERGLPSEDVFYGTEQQAIAFPVKDFKGEVVGIKYRKLDSEAKPRYLSETGSVNEGYWLKGPDTSKLLIVEGEIDALTAVCAEFRGAVLATQTNRISQSQIKHIKTFKNVFILPDNDLGGEELKLSANELLGAFNVTFISLEGTDCKDLNELWVKDPSKCTDFLRNSTQTALEKDTKSLNQAIPELLDWLSDDRHSLGDSTGWPSIDALLGGGLRAGEMTMINATAKAGKSSFINNLIHNLAKSGKKIALASFEMPPHSVYTSLISIALQTNIRGLSVEDREDLVNGASDEFSYLNNIIMLQRFGYTKWKDIEDWAIMIKQQNNIEYLVLDHAGFLVENMTDAEENQTLAKNIKKLTNTLGIHIPVVVQAPKTKDGLSLQTAYGGMSWAQNADNFFILERCKSDETLLKVRLEAARYPGSNPSYTPAHLFYTRETLSLTE